MEKRSHVRRKGRARREDHPCDAQVDATKARQLANTEFERPRNDRTRKSRGVNRGAETRAYEKSRRTSEGTLTGADQERAQCGKGTGVKEEDERKLQDTGARAVIANLSPTHLQSATPNSRHLIQPTAYILKGVLRETISPRQVGWCQNASTEFVETLAPRDLYRNARRRLDEAPPRSPESPTTG